MKIVSINGKPYAVTILPAGDASGDPLPKPTARLDGSNLRRFIRERQDEKQAGWKTPHDAHYAPGFHITEEL